MLNWATYLLHGRAMNSLRIISPALAFIMTLLLYNALQKWVTCSPEPEAAAAKALPFLVAYTLSFTALFLLLELVNRYLSSTTNQ